MQSHLDDVISGATLRSRFSSLSSLRFVIPPLRLFSAVMWEVARQQRTSHFGMLEDFVSLVTDAIPELLTGQQKSLLLLALRAKMTQEVLSGDVPVDPDGVRHHMERIHTVSMETSSSVLKQWASSLQALCHTVQERPEARQHLLQNLLDQDFTAALEGLLCHFLSRLNQSFPVPDFKQAAVWLSAPPAGMEECLQEIDSNREELKNLLSNQSYRLGHTTCPGWSVAEEHLLSTWSRLQLPPHSPASKLLVQSEPAAQQNSTQEEEDNCDAAGSGKESDTVIGQSQASIKQPIIALNRCDRSRGSQSEPACPPQNETESSVRGLQDSLQALTEQDRFSDSDCCYEDQPEKTGKAISPRDTQPTSASLVQKDHNTQRLAHKCPQCGQCFIYRSEVLRHLRTLQGCSGPPPLSTVYRSCFQCASSFQTDSELKAHSQAHQCPYQCSHCDKRFRLLSTLTTHQQTHRAAGGFTCGRCVGVFNSASELRTHRQTHRHPQLPSPLLGCPACSQTFATQTELFRHQQTHPATDRPFKCNVCDKIFTDLTQLRIHLREHKQRSFQCDQCPKSFITLQSLQVHGRRHSGPQAHLCSQCGKRFWTRGGLENHLRLHNGEKPFCCQDCGKSFTALAGLVVHVRLHTGERPYVCTVCGKGWPSKGDLQKHMRVHTGERPYVCQDCGKAFAISCHLNEHRRSHTGEKPFSCPKCGKCFIRKSTLKIHIHTHSDKRPHACSFCQKSYASRNHLNRHIRTHQTS
ncbi:Zinc finger protein 2 [Merluccius polli]|uniref:Zinc finger protein 865 n=1 Tax=Merluccius polli TaxID=89951 RepID=A0AA47MKV3_MERPO|nr:Zinc finger protein 2 [Merluccius polli]